MIEQFCNLDVQHEQSWVHPFEGGNLLSLITSHNITSIVLYALCFIHEIKSFQVKIHFIIRY